MWAWSGRAQIGFVAKINMALPSTSDIHIRDEPQDTRPRAKKAPTAKSIPVPFSYSPSDNGTDENLLILLHGLGMSCMRDVCALVLTFHPGDTHVPFGKLGQSFKLPQTATLAIRAPEQ